MKTCLTYRLCDNDFSGQMLRAAKHLVAEYGDQLATIDLEAFKIAMVCHMAGDAMVRQAFNDPGNRCSTLVSYGEHFSKARVFRDETACLEDCDYGAVSIALFGTFYTWIH